MYLLGVKTCLGERILDAKEIGIGDSNLFEKIGIEYIHEDERSNELELLVKTINEMLIDYGIEISQLDGIYVSTSNTYHQSTPGVEHLIAQSLGVSSSCKRMVIGNNCSGFIKAMQVAEMSMMQAKYKKNRDGISLVIVTDKWSNVKDTLTMPMLTDASGVAIVSTRPLTPSSRKIENITVKYPDSSTDLTCITQNRQDGLSMPNGSAVFKFAVNTGIDIFNILIQGYEGPWVYIPHNANKRIVSFIKKELPTIEVYDNAIQHGNLGGASIVYGLEEILSRSPLDNIVVGAFGANLESGGFLLTLQETLSVGLSKTISYADVDNNLLGYEYKSRPIKISQGLIGDFTTITGDNNPHYDPQYAQYTKSGVVPVPGLLQTSLIGHEDVIHAALQVNGADHILKSVSMDFGRGVPVGRSVIFKFIVEDVASTKTGKSLTRGIELIDASTEKVASRGKRVSFFQPCKGDYPSTPTPFAS